MDRCQLSNGQKQKTLWPRLLLVFISGRAKKNCPGSGWSTVSEHTLCNREVVGSNSAGNWDVFHLTILLVQCALKQVPREAAALLDAPLEAKRTE